MSASLPTLGGGAEEGQHASQDAQGMQALTEDAYLLQGFLVIPFSG